MVEPTRSAPSIFSPEGLPIPCKIVYFIVLLLKMPENTGDSGISHAIPAQKRGQKATKKQQGLKTTRERGGITTQRQH